MGIRIIGSGTYMPSAIETVQAHTVSAEDQDRELAGLFCGAHERRVCQDHETPIYMGIQAAKNALTNTNITPETVDVVLCCSGMDDYLYPKGVYGMLAEIGCNGAMAWSLDTACTSFLSHLNCANALSLISKKRFLIIESVNLINRALNVDDRDTGPGSLLGDGAVAVVADAEPGRGCLIDIIEKTNSLDFDFLKMGCAQVTGKRESMAFTKNHRIIYSAFTVVSKTALELLERNGLTGKDLTWTITNQPGINAIRKWHEMADIPIEKNLNTFAKYGNMLAANIPITLNHFLTIEPKIKRGDLILAFAAGAGVHCVAALIQY